MSGTSGIGNNGDAEEAGNRGPGGRWPLSEPCTISVDVLVPADSPRLSGESLEHARLLAEVEGALPPIIVHRPSMQVIDGMHRLHAAKLRGDEVIAVRMFDGAAADAFVLAVETNIRHGLPLSLADREAAAMRILASNPDWSDRAIAESAGLTWKTVGGIRRRLAGELPAATARVGKDGRARPVDGAAGRRLASDLIARRPEVSLREIARTAGISIGTARDVRERVRRGEDPIPPRLRRSAPAAARTVGRIEVTDLAATIDRLKRDPALRLNESGRDLLRWLDGHVVHEEECAAVAGAIPPHCADIIEAIARRCAQAWTALAAGIRKSAAEAPPVPRARSSGVRAPRFPTPDPHRRQVM